MTFQMLWPSANTNSGGQRPQKWLLSWLKHRQLATLVQAQDIAYMAILPLKSMRYDRSPDNLKKPDIARYDFAVRKSCKHCPYLRTNAPTHTWVSCNISAINMVLEITLY